MNTVEHTSNSLRNSAAKRYELSNAPEWLFEKEAPLTLDIWEAKGLGDGYADTVYIGNSGLSFIFDPDEDTLEQTFIPNTNSNLNAEKSFYYSSIYLMAIRQFANWWEKLPDENVFKQRSKIAGATNDTMFEFRKRILDILDEKIVSESEQSDEVKETITGYRDQYDKKMIYYIDLTRLSVGFEKVDRPGILRILNNGEKLVGSEMMVNPLLPFLKKFK